MNHSLQLSEFDYVLPPELIAQSPTPDRTGSRLLNLAADGTLRDCQFTDLPQLLKPNDLLVFNDTRVIKARLHGRKESGGKVEVLIERIIRPNGALAHIKASKSPKAGRCLIIDETLSLKVLGRQGELFELEFPGPVLGYLDRYGSTPLPPYIEHAAGQEDEARYQTVYARNPGAVAAPTAGLHFDQALLAQLTKQGIKETFITLHVGAGTFQPVRVQDLSQHIMHSEHYTVSEETLALVRSTRDSGGRVIAVGTTSVRALESAAARVGQSGRTEDDTRLFITPGYSFSCIDALITNFHLPQSTLLMLVSALAGMEPIRRAYAHAIKARYRFFSYGDAMFIESPK